jgi:hypothetical protein
VCSPGGVAAAVPDGDPAEALVVPGEEPTGVGAEGDVEHAARAKIIRLAAHVPGSPIWSAESALFDGLLQTGEHHGPVRRGPVGLVLITIVVLVQLDMGVPVPIDQLVGDRVVVLRSIFLAG